MFSGMKGSVAGVVNDASVAHSALCRAVRLFIRADAPPWARLVVWNELGAGRQLLHLLGTNEGGGGHDGGTLHELAPFAYTLPLCRQEATALADVVCHVTAPRHLCDSANGAAVAMRVALRQLTRACFCLGSGAAAERFVREGRLGWGQQTLLCHVARACEPQTLLAMLLEPTMADGADGEKKTKEEMGGQCSGMLPPHERWRALRCIAGSADVDAEERETLCLALEQVAALSSEFSL